MNSNPWYIITYIEYNNSNIFSRNSENKDLYQNFKCLGISYGIIYNDVSLFSTESVKKTNVPSGLYWPSQSYYHLNYSFNKTKRSRAIPNYIDRRKTHRQQKPPECSAHPSYMNAIWYRYVWGGRLTLRRILMSLVSVRTSAQHPVKATTVFLVSLNTWQDTRKKQDKYNLQVYPTPIVDSNMCVHTLLWISLASRELTIGAV